MLEATLRAIGQMRDRAFRTVLLASILWTLLAFILLGVAFVAVIGSVLGPHIAGWIGAVLVALATAWAVWLLFVPVAAGIATLYTDRIAASVEARWYPSLPPARPASLTAQAWDGVAVFLRLVAAQILVVLLLHSGVVLFIPGLAALVWLGLAGWAYARGLFVALAMRRMPRAQALAAWRARRGPAVGIGVLVAVTAFIPFLNLATPILGIAALVHVLERHPKVSTDALSWGDSASHRVLPRSPD